MTVCLNMIVKNESKIIESCLMALRPAIDAWLIVDTGSTDGTQRMVRETMYGIPGELHEHPWQDFSTNRNLALELARPWADYILFCDADMELRTEDADVFRKLTDPVYSMQQRNMISYFNTRVLRSDVPATYVGVTHEYLDVKTPVTKLWDAWYLDHANGSSRKDKFQRDAALLRAALQTDPTNCRYVYYLAQSLRDAGEYAEAARIYRQRASMLGWVEETWSAMYENGKLQERIGQNPRNAYLSAYQYRPTRAEPLYQLARYHRERREFALAYMYAKQGSQIPYPSDSLFIEDDVYHWKLLDELSVAAYYTGAIIEGRELIRTLLSNESVPVTERPRLETNLQLYVTPADPAGQ